MEVTFIQSREMLFSGLSPPVWNGGADFLASAAGSAEHLANIRNGDRVVKNKVISIHFTVLEAAEK